MKIVRNLKLAERCGDSRLCRIGSDLQIFDIKQMAEIEDYYKKECLNAYGLYRQWHEKRAKQSDMIALVYGHLEGNILRRHIIETVRAYWIIRRDYRAAYRNYLKNNQIGIIA